MWLDSKHEFEQKAAKRAKKTADIIRGREQINPALNRSHQCLSVKISVPKIPKAERRGMGTLIFADLH